MKMGYMATLTEFSGVQPSRKWIERGLSTWQSRIQSFRPKMDGFRSLGGLTAKRPFFYDFP